MFRFSRIVPFHWSALVVDQTPFLVELSHSIASNPGPILTAFAGVVTLVGGSVVKFRSQRNRPDASPVEIELRSRIVVQDATIEKLQNIIREAIDRRAESDEHTRVVEKRVETLIAQRDNANLSMVRDTDDPAS